MDFSIKSIFQAEWIHRFNRTSALKSLNGNYLEGYRFVIAHLLLRMEINHTIYDIESEKISDTRKNPALSGILYEVSAVVFSEILRRKVL